MCVNYKYKGMTIYKNKSPEFGTEYFSVINHRLRDKRGKFIHAHANNETQIREIVDCFSKINSGGKCWKYSRAVRNRAMQLSGKKVWMR